MDNFGKKEKRREGEKVKRRQVRLFPSSPLGLLASFPLGLLASFPLGLFALLFLFLLAFFPLSLFASSPGSTSANFLKIDPDVRAVGMGGAFVGLADDGSAIWYNPAGLANLKQKEISSMFNKWMENINYCSGELVYPARKWGTFGIGGTYLSIGNIQGYDEWGAPTKVLQASDFAGLFSYAHSIPLFRRLGPSVGVNLKFIGESLADKSATCFAFDFGCLLKPKWKLLGGTFQTGMVIQNLGTKMQFIKDGFGLPMIYRQGFAYQHDLLGSEWVVALDLNFPSDNKFYLNMGAECSLWRWITLRGGYTTRNALNTWSCGLGLGIPQLQLDYAFVPLGVLGPTHRLSCTFRFGKLKAYDLVQKEAEYHYRKAIEYQRKDALILAYQELENVLVLDPFHPEAKKLHSEIEIAFQEVRSERERKAREREIARQFRDGKKEFDSGNLLKAKEIFATILKLRPDHKGAKEYLEKIQKVLAEAMRQRVTAFNTEATAYFENSQYEEAIAQWKKILEIEPDNKGAKQNIKIAEEKLREIEAERKRAEEERLRQQKEKEQAKKLAKIKTLYKQGINYYNSKKWLKAIQSFNQVLKFDPKHSQARKHLKLAKQKLAEEYYRKGRQAYDKEETKKAIGLLEESLKNYKDYEEAADLLKTAQEKLKLTNALKAKKLYTEGLKAYATGDLKGAEKDWEKALEYEPDNEKVQNSLKRVRKELKGKRKR